MFNANYHSHSKYCRHASGKLSEYAEEAVRAGLKEIGISDHIPLSENAKKVLAPYIRLSGSLSLMMDFSDLQSYINDVATVKSAFKNQLNVLAGFESEYNQFDADYYRQMKTKVDFMNLGIHYVYADGILYDFMDNKVHEDFGIRRVEKRMWRPMFKMPSPPWILDFSTRWCIPMFSCAVLRRKILIPRWKNIPGQ